MDKKGVFKKVLIILTIIMILSMFLTAKYDDTKIEFIFRLIWITLMFICTLLRGVWLMFEEKNKPAGYFYFILAFIFIGIILNVYLKNS